MTQEMMALTDLASKMARIEVMQDANTKTMAELTGSINRLVDKLDNSDDIAREALQSTRSAHHRIEELRGELKSHRDLMQIKFKEQDEATWRRLGTSLTIGGLLISAASFAINYFIN